MQGTEDKNRRWYFCSSRKIDDEISIFDGKDSNKILFRKKEEYDNE